MGKLADYLELFKIKQSFLLIFAGVLGVLIAGGFKIDVIEFLVFLSACMASVFGTTGLNMYYDRDIDSIMFRTKFRPLPDERINPDEAYLISLVLAVVGIIIGFQINFWTGLAVFLGFFIDAFLYTVLLKRKTIFNIVVGAFAGGMLPFGGYVMVTGSPDIYSLLLMLIVALWAMNHIWFISIYYIEDYRAANIPMFPVVYGERKTAFMGIFITLIIQGIVVFMWWVNFTGLYSLIITSLMSLGVIGSIIRYLRSMNKETARKIFKFLSPYLGIILLSVGLERALLILT